jgi:DNA-binding MarR family transcriptional regulator
MCYAVTVGCDEDAVEDRDAIDALIDQWRHSPYDLPLLPMSVSKRITRISRNLDHGASKALAPFGVDPGEFDVLATILRNGPPFELTPTALNRSLLISSGGLTKRLLRLEKAGLVTRRLGTTDRRSLLVALTSEGKSLAEAAVRAHTEACSHLLDSLEPGDRDRLVGLLRRILLAQESGPTD